ncbi:MipA/OmpV family protein [Cupriavidus basilensis]|uniref:MipA/OmpV family protein n=1 Tax=Cupriavidus basilensis TaxID=68895 RepID=UPI0035A31F9C
MADYSNPSPTAATAAPMGNAARWPAALAVVAAFSAHAQTPSPLAEWQYSAGVPLMKLYGAKVPEWQVQVGAAASLRPVYEGTQRYHVLAGPSFDIRYRDLLFVSTGEGVGVNLLRADHWRAGVAIGYNLGRRMADDPGRLNGLGNINFAAESKLFGEYAVSAAFPLVVRIDVRRSLGGTDGWIGDIGAYLPLPGSSERFFWFAGPTVTFGDARYMSRWFGVTSAQATRSGYPLYKADAGLKSYGAGISAIWFFREHWFVTGDIAVGQLTGSAAHSPITQKATNTVVDLSLHYQY